MTTGQIKVARDSDKSIALYFYDVDNHTSQPDQIIIVSMDQASLLYYKLAKLLEDKT